MNSQTAPVEAGSEAIFKWWHGALFLLLAYLPGIPYPWREELFPGFLSPPLRPPGAIFPVIWITINICMIWAGLRILNNSGLRRRSFHIAMHTLYWVCFVIFPYFFFGKSSPVLGGLITFLIFIIAFAETITLWKGDRKTAYLMLPLLAWTSFASFYASVWQVLYNPDPYLGLPALLT
jgi:benzodiazapine receptor